MWNWEWQMNSRRGRLLIRGTRAKNINKHGTKKAYLCVYWKWNNKKPLNPFDSSLWLFWTLKCKDAKTIEPVRHHVNQKDRHVGLLSTNRSMKQRLVDESPRGQLVIYSCVKPHDKRGIKCARTPVCQKRLHFWCSAAVRLNTLI